MTANHSNEIEAISAAIEKISFETESIIWRLYHLICGEQTQWMPANAESDGGELTALHCESQAVPVCEISSESVEHCEEVAETVERSASDAGAVS